MQLTEISDTLKSLLPMHHAYRTTELAAEDRSTIERLLGRMLQPDEAIEIIAYVIPELAEAETVARQGAFARILELAKGKHVGGLSARDLIEEAHLELALRPGIPLATGDKNLVQAARAMKVPLFEP